MAISPAVLHRQRAEVRAVAVPTLRLVPYRPRGGKAPSCECGECLKCRKREAMRAYRAKGDRTPAPRGPSMALGRTCSLCRGPIKDKNRTGICGDCYHGHATRRHRIVATRAPWFSHGGGI